MKLQVESWAELNLMSNAAELMSEATICYKVGAYKGAYLSSYLAFKTELRDRILHASKPNAIDAEFWEKEVVKKLEDDNTWEGTLNNIIDASKENAGKLGAVFKFTDYTTVKTEYNYWRNIRNCCAHNKQKRITSSTIEQFWNYMQDELPKFYVSGGKEYLLEELYNANRYWDSVGEDKLEHILDQIAIVYKDDIVQCFETVFKKNSSSLTTTESNLAFYKIIMDYHDERVRDAFLELLYSNSGWFLDWYNEFPKLFHLMDNKYNTFVQENLVPRLENGMYVKEEAVFWKLLVDILRNKSNILDLDKVTDNYTNFKRLEHIKLNEEELNVLRNHKVFNKFLLHAGRDFFRNDADSHWDYYNSCSNKDDSFVRKCFEYVEWDIEIIEKLNVAYEELEYSAKNRQNPSSIKNADCRRTNYDLIIAKFKADIMNVIQEANKQITDYVYIQSSLQKQNL